MPPVHILTLSQALSLDDAIITLQRAFESNLSRGPVMTLKQQHKR